MNRNELDIEWTVIEYYANGAVWGHKTNNPGQYILDAISINRDLQINLSTSDNPIVRIAFVAPDWYPSRVYGKGGNPVPVSAEERTEIARQKIDHPYEMPNRSVPDVPGF